MNPKATVVSILPYEIYESKPNLYPGNFTIPASVMGKPGLLLVTDSTFYVPMAFGAPSLAAKSSAYEVANSIVNDYVGALLGIDDNCKPGIWVENKEFKDHDLARVELATKMVEKLSAQRNWYVRLVNEADAEYQKHHQARSISDLQKLAAKELNLKDKPWMLDITQLSVNNCPACYSPVNINAVICGHCRYVINPDKYKIMQFDVSIPSPTPAA